MKELNTELIYEITIIIGLTVKNAISHVLYLCVVRMKERI